jgi:chemotaxis protein CheD
MMADWQGVVHTLHPGDVARGERGDRLVTLLGSCIAVVMTDPRRTIGVMCHIVHCTDRTASPRDTSWGDVALIRLYQLLRERGIEPRMCEAYVYGGGNMFPSLVGASNVGSNNALWVLEALDKDGVNVVFSDVGGCAYRRLSWIVGSDVPVVVAVSVQPYPQQQDVEALWPSRCS